MHTCFCVLEREREGQRQTGGATERLRDRDIHRDKDRADERVERENKR